MTRKNRSLARAGRLGARARRQVAGGLLGGGVLAAAAAGAAVYTGGGGLDATEAGVGGRYGLAAGRRRCSSRPVPGRSRARHGLCHDLRRGERHQRRTPSRRDNWMNDTYFFDGWELPHHGVHRRRRPRPPLVQSRTANPTNQGDLSRHDAGRAPRRAVRRRSAQGRRAHRAGRRAGAGDAPRRHRQPERQRRRRLRSDGDVRLRLQHRAGDVRRVQREPDARRGGRLRLHGRRTATASSTVGTATWKGDAVAVRPARRRALAPGRTPACSTRRRRRRVSRPTSTAATTSRRCPRRHRHGGSGSRRRPTTSTART